MSILSFNSEESAAATQYFSTADRVELSYAAASEADNQNLVGD